MCHADSAVKQFHRQAKITPALGARTLVCALVLLCALVQVGAVQAQRGAPVFQVRQPFANSGILSSIIFDLDSQAQLRPIGSVSFVQAGCAGPLDPPDPLPCPVFPLVLGDVNGDGADEILQVIQLGGSQRVNVLDQAGLVLETLIDLGDLDNAAIWTADMDGDGQEEFVVTRGAALQVHDESGNLLMSSNVPALVSPNFAGLDFADVAGGPGDELLVALSSAIEVYSLAGDVLSSFVVPDLPAAAVAAGDVDGDGAQEIVVRDERASGASVRWFDINGNAIDGFEITFEDDVGYLAVGDVTGGPADEILIGLSNFPSLLDDDLVVFDNTGTELARSFGFFFYTPPDPPFDNSGPIQLVVGKRPYPDADGDGLLDPWEKTGVPFGANGLFPLRAIGADPDHKDLFLELDWMRDPGLTERGNGQPGRPIGPTCSDGIDNDGDGDADAADLDCYDNTLLENGTPSCNDGLDNDGDGNTDGADTDCLVGDASLAETGAGPNSCADGIDNDGDGNTDIADSDCLTLDVSRSEAAAQSCADGFDNDGDGVADANDADCANALFAEAAPGSCGDGFDNDGDGRIDTADLDCTHAPTQFDVRTMKAAFCSAPKDSGGVTNPDDRPGINLWIDTGILADSSGAETGVMPCTCGDGIDNDLDGLEDAADPDCLLGYDPTRMETSTAGSGLCADGADNDFDGLMDAQDPDCRTYDPRLAETSSGPGTCNDDVDNDGDGLKDLADLDCLVGDPGMPSGGGNEITLDQICRLNGDFYDAKADNFANFLGQEARALVFRYAISAQSCMDSGGWGEVGGNDFIEYNHDAGTMMHELGHTLNLRHGGDNSDNCKPNYVSVMNYDNQFAIRQVGAPSIIDYSPPRFFNGRGVAPLATLEEDDLDETLALDSSDPSNSFVFKDGNGATMVWPLNGDIDGDAMFDGIDWDGDGASSSTSVQVNVDTSGPAACMNNSTDDKLAGHDDWTSISLPFRGFGDSEDGPVNENDEPEIMRHELELLERQVSVADLAVSLSADANPVEVGEVLKYTVAARNFGPNPAAVVQLDGLLPASVVVTDYPASCSLAGTNLDCAVGTLPAGAVREMGVAVDTDNACINGIPMSLVNRASITNLAPLAGADPRLLNNTIQLTTDTIDTTPPEVQCNVPDTIKPNDVTVSFTATATDICDATPDFAITDFDCFKFTKKGKRIDKTKSCEVAFNGDTVTILDSGGVDDHITWTVVATDASGNQATTTCAVLVVNPGNSGGAP